MLPAPSLPLPPQSGHKRWPSSPLPLQWWCKLEHFSTYTLICFNDSKNIKIKKIKKNYFKKKPESISLSKASALNNKINCHRDAIAPFSLVQICQQQWMWLFASNFKSFFHSLVRLPVPVSVPLLLRLSKLIVILLFNKKSFLSLDIFQFFLFFSTFSKPKVKVLLLLLLPFKTAKDPVESVEFVWQNARWYSFVQGQGKWSPRGEGRRKRSRAKKEKKRLQHTRWLGLGWGFAWHCAPRVGKFFLLLPSRAKKNWKQTESLLMRRSAEEGREKKERTSSRSRSRVLSPICFVKTGNQSGAASILSSCESAWDIYPGKVAVNACTVSANLHWRKWLSLNQVESRKPGETF